MNRNKIKKSLTAIILATSIFMAYSKTKFNLEHKNLSINCANGNVVIVDAEIAKTEASRNFGFMERKNIPDGTGMLFVFEEDSVRSFWMHNTPTALSIAYIDRNGKIRDIFDMVPYSEESVMSTVSVRYALEVPQGFFERAGVKVGDILDLSVL